MAKNEFRRLMRFNEEPEKDYRTKEYGPYTMALELGIVRAWKYDRNVKDSDARQLIRLWSEAIKEDKDLTTALAEIETDVDERTFGRLNAMRKLVLENFAEIVAKNGPLNGEDTRGILTVMDSSISTWGGRMKRRGYLKYLKDILRLYI